MGVVARLALGRADRGVAGPVTRVTLRLATFMVLLGATSFFLLAPQSTIEQVLGGAPEAGEGGIPGFDKLVHVALFAGLSLLAPPRRLALALLAAYAATTEALQAVVPGRSPDAIDLLADLAGLAVGALVARFTWRRADSSR